MSALAAMVAAASEMSAAESSLSTIRRQHSRAVAEVISMEQKQKTVLQSLKLGDYFKPLIEGYKKAKERMGKAFAENSKKAGGSGGSGGGGGTVLSQYGDWLQMQKQQGRPGGSTAISVRTGGGSLSAGLKILGFLADRARSQGTAGGSGGGGIVMVSYQRQTVTILREISLKIGAQSRGGGGASVGMMARFFMSATSTGRHAGGRRAMSDALALPARRRLALPGPKAAQQLALPAPKTHGMLALPGPKPRATLGSKIGNFLKGGVGLAKKGAGAIGNVLRGAFNIAGKGAQMFGRMIGTAAQGIGRMIGMAARLGSTLVSMVGPAIAGVTAFLASPPGLIAGAAGAVVALVGVSVAAGKVAGAVSAAAPMLQSFAGSVIFAKGFQMAQPFMEAGQQLEAAQRTFAGAAGGAQEGRDMVDWIQSYKAGGSSVAEDKLQGAALTMIRGGVDPTKHLKTAEMLAINSGMPADQAIGEAAALLADLSNGKTERLADLERFQIDPTQFEGQEGSGLLNSLNTNLAADPKTQELMDMSNTGLAQVEQGMYAIQTVIQDIGVAFGEVFGPILKEAGKHLMDLSASGVFTEIINGFAELFGMGGDGENPLVGTIDTLVGFLKTLPEKIQQIIDKISGFLEKIGAIGGAIKKAGELAGWLNPMTWGSKLGSAVSGYFYKGNKEKTEKEWAGAIKENDQRAKDAAGKGTENDAARDKRLARASELNALEKRKQEIANTSAPTPPKEEKVDPKADLVTALNESNAKSVQHLANIDRQTEQLVQANRLMAGGGQLGRLGISAIEASKMSYGERSRSGPRARRVAAMIEDAITELMHETLGQERRQQGMRYA